MGIIKKFYLLIEGDEDIQNLKIKKIVSHKKRGDDCEITFRRTFSTLYQPRYWLLIQNGCQKSKKSMKIPIESTEIS